MYAWKNDSMVHFQGLRNLIVSGPCDSNSYSARARIVLSGHKDCASSISMSSSHRLLHCSI